jgi:hypothetical protein
MDNNQDLAQEQLNRLLAPKTAASNPFIPSAVSADTGSLSPFFRDATKEAEEENILSQLRKGQAGVSYAGTDYDWYQDRQSDINAFGNLGAEYRQKYSVSSSKGWGEQSTYARDAWLRWAKGQSGDYFWNPQDMADPTNVHNQTSYGSALWEGIGKWFATQDEDLEFAEMKKNINNIDPAFSEDVRVTKTDEFLQKNPGVAKLLLAGGIDLYDYTRPAVNEFGHRFAIHNAVIDANQNIRLKQWDENNQAFFGAGKFADMLTYGLQDPLLVRDIVATTALTLGLGTVEMGAARLATALGTTTTAGLRSMQVARTASNVLQLTSPLTGFAEGPVYKALQALAPIIGRSGAKTALARGLAIATEAGAAAGVSAFEDQRNAFDWKQLITQNKDDYFTPEWTEVAQGAATGFFAGGAMLGVMRFGLGMVGDIRYIRKGDYKGYWKNVASSLDTWRKTDQGLTVFGERLSGGAGVFLGDLYDHYMSKIDNRDYASVMLNGRNLYSNAVFSPSIAAKSTFDGKAATEIANQFAKATGLPGEVIQDMPATNTVRIFFDNLMDPDYMKQTGLTYADSAKIIESFNNRRAGIVGPTEVTVPATAKALAEVDAKNSIKALADIFELDRINRLLDKTGISFNTVASRHLETTGRQFDFGRMVDRDNFRVIASYEANKNRVYKNMDLLAYARPNALKDLQMEDGTVIKGDVVSKSLRKALKLDENKNRIFITDSQDGSDPTFIISVEPDGTLNKHATKLVTNEFGQIKIEAPVTKEADYVAANIKGLDDMQQAYNEIHNVVSKEYEAEKKLQIEKVKKELAKEAKSSPEVAGALADIGKLPTRQVLRKHFGLTSEEASVAEIVLETMGLDVEGAILKIARANKADQARLGKAKAKASIQWEAIKSGVSALIRSTKESDFGSLVHEMGHYNRVLLIGSTEEHANLRRSLGISDELWDKFSDWVGYKGVWETDIAKMSKEQIKAEEKFANAWAWYIRSVISGDGKTNVTGLHRLFSAMGDHLGDIGKKMQSQVELEKGLDMTPLAKEVYEKLFLRSQNKLTKFWQLAEKGVFAKLDPEARAKLGEHILGTEMWNTYQAGLEKSIAKSKKVTDKIAKPRVPKVKITDILDSIAAKVAGEGYEPTKTAIRLALKAGKTEQEILDRIAVLSKTMTTLPPSPLRMRGDTKYFASHVKNLSDEQLSALAEGTMLQPIPGVVKWVYNPVEKNLDVSFPVLIVTKELIEKELLRRKQRAEALKRLSEAKKKLEAKPEPTVPPAKPVEDTVDSIAAASSGIATKKLIEEAIKSGLSKEYIIERLNAFKETLPKNVGNFGLVSSFDSLPTTTVKNYKHNRLPINAEVTLDSIDEFIKTNGKDAKVNVVVGFDVVLTKEGGLHYVIKVYTISLEDLRTEFVKRPAKPEVRAEELSTPSTPELKVETEQKFLDAVEEAVDTSRSVTDQEKDLIKNLSIEELRMAFREEPFDGDAEVQKLVQELRAEREAEYSALVAAEAKIADEDTELQSLVEQLRAEREAEEASKAASEVVEATKIVEETKIEEPEAELVLEPAEAMAQIRATDDPRFVDGEGNIVPELSIEERAVVNAANTVSEDITVTQNNLSTVVAQVSDPTVPIERISVEEVRPESPETVNVETRVTASVDETVVQAVNTASDLQTRAETEAAQLPEAVVEVVNEAVDAVVANPTRVKELLRIVLENEELAKESDEIQVIVKRYFELRARYRMLDDYLIRMGIITEEQRDMVKKLDPTVKDRLESNTKFEKASWILSSPEVMTFKLSDNPTRSEMRMHEEVTQLLAMVPTLLKDVAESTGIPLKTVQDYCKYSIDIATGSMTIANDVDRRTMGFFKEAYEEYEKLAADLSADNTQRLKELKPNRGKYLAAEERIKNRMMYGAAIVKKKEKTSALDKTILEIANEKMKMDKESMPLLVTANSDGDMRARAAGADPKQSRAIPLLNIKDVFSTQGATPRDATLPLVRAFRDTNMINGVGLNTLKLGALVLTHEFTTNAGVNFIKSGSASLAEYISKTYDTPNKLLKAAVELGFANANENPLAYHGLLAFLAGEQQQIAAMFPNAIKNLSDSIAYVESLLKVSDLSKKAPDTPARMTTKTEMTETRLAYWLINDRNFVDRVSAINKNVDAQLILAKILRSEEGLKKFLITRLNLDKNASIEEVLLAAKDWGKKGGEKTRMRSSIKVVAERLNLDLENAARGKDTVSGDAGKADADGGDGAGLLVSVAAREESDLANATFIDRIQGLFFEYLRDKYGNRTLKDPMQDYFVARLTAGNTDNKSYIETVNKAILELTGKDIGTKNIETREDKLAQELLSFFKDLEEDPTVAPDIKETIQIFKRERVGIGAPKTKSKKPAELMQAHFGLSKEINKLLRRDTTTSVKDIVDLMETQFPGFFETAAKNIRKSSNWETVSQIPVFLVRVENKTGNFIYGGDRASFMALNPDYDLSLGSTFIHELVHAISSDAIDRLTAVFLRDLKGVQYYKALEDYAKFAETLQREAIPVRDVVVDLINAYLAALNDKTINKTGFKFLNNYKEKSHYGFTNIHEFISEALSNANFAELLSVSMLPTAVSKEANLKAQTYAANLLGDTDLTLSPNSILAHVISKTFELAPLVDQDLFRVPSKRTVRKDMKLLGFNVQRDRKGRLDWETELDELEARAAESGVGTKAWNDYEAALGRFEKATKKNQLFQSTYDAAVSEPKMQKWFSGSKVVQSSSVNGGSDIAPLMLFHGSPDARHVAFRYDFTKSYPHLLWGNGVYMTEDSGIAASYTKSKTDGNTIKYDGVSYFAPSNRAVTLTYYQLKDLLGEDTHGVDVLDNYLTKSDRVDWYNVDYFIKYLDDEGVDDDTVKKVLDVFGFRKHETYEGVYPLFSSIKKPIDADNDVFNGQYLIDLVQKLDDKDNWNLIKVLTKLFTEQEFKNYPKTTNLKFDSFFNDVKNEGLEHVLIKALMLDDYDGLTHIGGGRAGRGKTMHRVWISWEEGQIKSPFAEDFNPEAASILAQGKIDTDPLQDAVDLRRRKLSELGLHEETTPEDLNAIQRIMNGLQPYDIGEDRVFKHIKTPMELAKDVVPKTEYMGRNYRDLNDSERRDFVTNAMLPKIREVLGDRNSTAGLYSAASGTTFGKKTNALIGGAVAYADTADSQSVLLQFISKIFDPMMDLRDGELKNKFNLFSVDKMNSEVNNMLLRSGLVQLRDKILSRVKDQDKLKRINDVAWMYLTRPGDVPAGPNRDLIMDTITATNKFNELTVDLLSNYGNLSKNTDSAQYGTPHMANNYAQKNQAEFVTAMTNYAVKKTVANKEISLITCAALGWVEIKRDGATDKIVSIKISEDSPLAKMLDEKQIGKRLEWSGDIRKKFADIANLDADSQKIHNEGLLSTKNYTQDWKDAYGSKGEGYTAIRQSMEVAKNRYLGIDFGDSKSAAPKRLAMGEGRNYTEERILSHDEITTDPELHKFFNKDIFQLSHDHLRGHITDAMMTKYISEFFGSRMSMDDIIQILSTVGEEVQGREHLSAIEMESRQRGYDRVRESWNASIGNSMSSKDSVDKYYKVLLENSRIPLVIASGLRAAVTSVPETARALLTSNKNQTMVRQFLPNLVKMASLVGPGGKQRRLARQQMISASHWLRGLSTDHLLHRTDLHPDNPFNGTIFGQGAGGMVTNFVNTWRAAGKLNEVETNWLQRAANRASAVSAAVGAPLAFVNDVTTLLHIWNAQENLTTNVLAFEKLANELKKNPNANYSQFAALARQCGLGSKEALDLSTAGLLDPKYIELLKDAAKDQTVYTDGIMDIRKLYIWAKEDPDRLEAINRMGSYINMTARHTNTEPTLLDIRVNHSMYGKALGQYMQFMLSMGVQEIGRRRRTLTSGYTQHLAGLVLMEIMAYGTTRALSDPEDDEMGGWDEFEKNPYDYIVRTATSLPLLGSYAFLSQVARHAIMGTSEFLGGPGAEQQFRIPDLIGGPASTAPRRLGEIPGAVQSWYNTSYDILGELVSE